MDGYWNDIDSEILDALTARGPMDPADLARTLGMSTEAVCSCLAMLAEAGQIRIRSVEATRQPVMRPRAA
jgi:DNA-binding Lrp family transcriptional regulator